jgi:protein-disulfide isomerase
MNRRLIVAGIGALALAGFGAAMFAYRRQQVEVVVAPPPAGGWNHLVREHSPVIGPPGAPVTIVEFFDPSCEACRAFHPVVKQVLAAYPNEVRVVIRYTPFHRGSDVAVAILEAARHQNLFEPVLEALLASQPRWARHDAPDMEMAWRMAAFGGLDLERAREDAVRPEVAERLRQDVADVQTAGVRGTPTFFVNGRQLVSLGAQSFQDLVREEVEMARRTR